MIASKLLNYFFRNKVIGYKDFKFIQTIISKNPNKDFSLEIFLAFMDYDKLMLAIASITGIQILNKINHPSELSIVENDSIKCCSKLRIAGFSSKNGNLVVVRCWNAVDISSITKLKKENQYICNKKNFTSLLENYFKQKNLNHSTDHLSKLDNKKSARDLKYPAIVLGIISCFTISLLFIPEATYIFCSTSLSLKVIWQLHLISNSKHKINKKTTGYAKNYFDRYQIMKSVHLPAYTIIIPLYKEADKLKDIIQAMGDLIYPKYKLDIKLAIEEDDITLHKALTTIELPYYFQVIKVPQSFPKTKPKAINYASYYAYGEYLVVYDAEDQPDPYQLLISLRKFSKLPENYCCLQAKLNFYNAEENLLSQLISLEYTVWFNYLLVGMDNLNLPIPLGGSSNHFKFKTLCSIGLWDAYNVTEDADLGIRIYLQGYKTSMIDTYTMEEAPIVLANWMYQRSRWIKGFIQTFLVYLRQRGSQKNYKLSLFQRISIWYNICLTFLGFLVMPWASILALYYDSAGIFFAINIACTIFYHNLLILAIFSREKSRIKFHRKVLIFFIVPFYFILHSIASYMALYEIVFKPFRWNKTQHGMSRITNRRNL